MRRILVALSVVAIGVVGMAGTSIASSGPNASGTFKDGPYTGTSQDSSTCGNNWAVDLYVRNFTVTLPANQDGSYTVKEKFSKGHFSTLKGQSAGACDTNPGGTIKSGIAGTFGGFETGTVSGGTFDPNGACELNGDGLCTTSGWVHGFFGNGSSELNVTPFKFTYNSNDPALQYSHWVNADASNGGNSGDIATP